MTSIEEVMIAHEAPTARDRGPSRTSQAPAIATALALGIALTAAAALSVPAGAPTEGAVSPARYLGNDFCLAILVAGIAAIALGCLELVGLALDERDLAGTTTTSGLARWLTARGDTGRALAIGHETTPELRAALAADRWDTLRAMRAAPLAFAVWALPLLGFIGTVIGISGAIGGLGGVFAEAGREEALTDVLGSLRYAFDTTFLGLVLALPAMALSTAIRARSDTVRHTIVLAASAS